MAMVRKQIYIEESQNEDLKKLAEDQGISEAEVLRRAITLAKQESEAAEVRRSGERLVQMMRDRAARLPDGGGSGKVSRDDVYYERLSKHLR
jgi:hypothetical protein